VSGKWPHKVHIMTGRMYQKWVSHSDHSLRCLFLCFVLWGVGDCSCFQCSCVGIHVTGLFRLRSFCWFIVFVRCLSIPLKINNHHAAFWSSSLSPEDDHYRITHHQRTKQRGNGQQQERQRYQDSWTWERDLD
jgi:hypothetical protein